MSESKERVSCSLCPHACSLKEGQVGMCHARRAVKGRIESESYGRITALALDPIEKKPLMHFMPGSFILSVGSFGCNLHCPFCQNASIAQVGIDEVHWKSMAPEELVERALLARAKGNVGIAYTYNEPLVNYEFVKDCAKLAHKAGLVNVLVSNGMANREVIEELSVLLDAANIDVKGFTQGFYDRVGGSLETVKRTVEILACSTCHVEVTTLVVPGMNDSENEIESIAKWISALDPKIPYHLSRFFPCYKMSECEVTSVETILSLVNVARKHLRFVHAGNC